MSIRVSVRSRRFCQVRASSVTRRVGDVSQMEVARQRYVMSQSLVIIRRELKSWLYNYSSDLCS